MICLGHADVRYYALSALAAALHYIEREQGFAFMAGSLRVSYVALEGTLFIDVDSARNLELVKNNITHKTYNTLYGERRAGRHTHRAGILNHCKTPMGSRMLLMSILQPPNSASRCCQPRLTLDRDLIESRLDVVQGTWKCVGVTN